MSTVTEKINLQKRKKEMIPLLSNVGSACNSGNFYSCLIINLK